MSDAAEILKSGPIDKGADLLHKLAGPAFEEFGAMLADRVRVWRVKNLISTTKKTEQLLLKAGLPPNAVPPRLLLPIIENSSIEDNETLQEMWAGLLASASNQADDLSPSYVETLKALTPTEARSIKVLYDFLIASPSSTLGSHEDVSNIITFGLGLAVGEAIAPNLILETLERLGLIRRNYDLQKNPFLNQAFTGSNYAYVVTNPPFDVQGFESRYRDPNPGTSEPMPKLIYELAFTSYGIQFMRACQGPASATGATDQASAVFP